MGIRQETITTFLSGTVLVDDLKIYFISDGRNRIVHLTFADDGHYRAMKMLASRNSKVVFSADEGMGNLVEQAVGRYLEGNARHLHLQTGTQLSGQATDFQKQVWLQISRIAYGSTRTYGDIARSLGNFKLARAVGQACHANPLALLVPCHRVIGSDHLGGFAGGIAIKNRLLAVERRFSGAER
jgi:methylated-DNA-[protein]-cysteine S-methyltransferase